jgi:hypothetical protein
MIFLVGRLSGVGGWPVDPSKPKANKPSNATRRFPNSEALPTSAASDTTSSAPYIHRLYPHDETIQHQFSYSQGEALWLSRLVLHVDTDKLLDPRLSICFQVSFAIRIIPSNVLHLNHGPRYHAHKQILV